MELEHFNTDSALPNIDEEFRYTTDIEVYNGFGQFLGVLNDYESAQFTWSAEASDLEASNISVPGTSMWAKQLMRANMQIMLVHMILYRNGKRIKLWTGRVERCVRKSEGPQSSIEVELISDKAYLTYIMAWSAPFAHLQAQFPKKNIKSGPAIHILKQYLSDNVLRLQSSRPQLNAALIKASTYQNNAAELAGIERHMPFLKVIPTPKATDTSPFCIQTVGMTPMVEVFQEVCKDYNLLPTVTMLMPDRDPIPSKWPTNNGGIFFDIVDKDKARSRGEKKSEFSQFAMSVVIFVRGLFGHFDTPQQIEISNPEQLKDYFGRYDTDTWPILRDSSEHWASREVAVYAPTTGTSIVGGKSPEWLNTGINLLVNTIIKGALSFLGIIFGGTIPTGFLEDVFLAYQSAEDKTMKDFYGPFMFPEDYDGNGLTAYSLESSQALRQARWSAIGYRTATFSGNSSSFRPFRIFEDFDLLDPMAWEDEIEGQIFTERLKQVTVSIERNTGVQFEVRLGELERPEEPWAIQSRANERTKRAIISALNNF